MATIQNDDNVQMTQGQPQQPEDEHSGTYNQLPQENIKDQVSSQPPPIPSNTEDMQQTTNPKGPLTLSQEAELDRANQLYDDADYEEVIEDIEDQWGVHPIDLYVPPTPLPRDPDMPPSLSQEGSSDHKDQDDCDGMLPNDDSNDQDSVEYIDTGQYQDTGQFICQKVQSTNKQRPESLTSNADLNEPLGSSTKTNNENEFLTKRQPESQTNSNVRSEHPESATKPSTVFDMDNSQLLNNTIQLPITPAKPNVPPLSNKPTRTTTPKTATRRSARLLSISGPSTMAARTENAARRRSLELKNYERPTILQ